MPAFSVRGSSHRASGDQYMDALEAATQTDQPAEHPLDSDESIAEHKQLLSWYYHERELQAANRMEMAIDNDFYDNFQWTAEDAAVVRGRGQLPLVYNEVAVMIDWLIGTERRTPIDWRVMPRTDDDVEMADVKTKVLKYVSDINRVSFARSAAFADAAKVGIGWVDDGARDDPTQDAVYSSYEDWRNVLWDSACYDRALSDARYLFRWRWVDEDVALMTYPERAEQIKAAVERSGMFSLDTDGEESWHLGVSSKTGDYSGVISASGRGVPFDTRRKRVRLIEAQYRKPARVRVVADGVFKGVFVDPSDTLLLSHLEREGATILDRVVMRVHMAVMTETHLLSLGPSTYRHNRFTLTPIWAYRYGASRLPYGPSRRVRDIQQDLNKRASKALFLLNTNQIVATEGASSDWEHTREEASTPDGIITYKRGESLELRRDTDAANGQISMMELAAQSIQKISGINNENLGRATNAVSGAAISARQQQGAVSTTELFDNRRLAVQVQGEKQLSLVEQFYTEEKVARLTGAKGAIEWVRINHPETQPDGSVRVLDDITASMADFVVSEADYAGTLRQVMFESLQAMALKLAPEVAVRLFVIAMEFSDLPNKDEIASALRALVGDRDPSKEMTPEEAQQAEQQMAAQAEAMQAQREAAMLALDEQRAKVRKMNAEADAALSGQGGNQEAEAIIQQVREKAAQEIDALSDALRRVQTEAAQEIMALRADKSAVTDAARIKADAEVRVAEISRKSDEQIGRLEERMAQIVADVNEAKREALDEARRIASESRPEPKQEPAEPQAPAQPNVTNITMHIDAKTGAVKKDIQIRQDAKGNITGGEVTETPIDEVAE